MRTILAAASSDSDVPDKWCSAHIHRERNTDPDRLSHPSNRSAVELEAVQAGFTVIPVHLIESDWEILFSALEIELAQRVELGPSKSRKRKRITHSVPSIHFHSLISA